MTEQAGNASRDNVSAVDVSPQRSSSARILELDALRGIAALAVVLFHFTTRYNQLFVRVDPLPMTFSWGDFGVDLFFMLSGFVILMTLERTTSGLKFAWGRFTRLYPAYWAAVAVTFAAVAAFGLAGQQVGFAAALVNLTMIQSLLGAQHVDGAYWSLQAELIFYVNMLILYRLGAFRRPSATAAVWVMTAALAIACQRYTVAPLAGGILSKLITVTSLKYIGMFAIGILLYDGRRRSDGQLLRWGVVGCCLAFIGFRSGFTAMFVDASLASILLLAVTGRLRWLNTRWLTFLGAISYTLYLTHQNIGYIVIANLEQIGVHPMIAIIVAVAVALLLAVALHRLVERPALEHLRRVDVTAAWAKLSQSIAAFKSRRSQAH